MLALQIPVVYLTLCISYVTFLGNCPSTSDDVVSRVLVLFVLYVVIDDVTWLLMTLFCCCFNVNAI